MQKCLLIKNGKSKKLENNKQMSTIKKLVKLENFVKQVTCKNNVKKARLSLLYPLLKKNLDWSKLLEGRLHHSLFEPKLQQ